MLIPDERLEDEDKFYELTAKMSGSELRLFEAMLFNAGKPKPFSTKEFKKRGYFSKKYLYECSDKLVENGNKPKPYRISGNALATALPFVALIPTVAVLLYFSILQNAYVLFVFLIFMAAGTWVGIEFRIYRFLLMLIFPLTFYGAIYFICVFGFAIRLYDYAGLWIIAPAWRALCLFVFPYFLKGVRSDYSIKIYPKLKGFKNFLLLTELPRIQLFFDKHPDYFAQIMPYCYVMGISKKVQKRFASLKFTPPAYMAEGLDPVSIGKCASHSCHHSSFSLGGSGGRGGGGGGGGGGSSGGGGGGGGSRGC